MSRTHRSRPGSSRLRAAGRHGHPATIPPPVAAAAPPATTGDWLTLTDLGRLYGISTLHTGRLLIAAGLRQLNGDPSETALAHGLAQPSQEVPLALPALWQGEGCGEALERLGQVRRHEQNLVGLWADLLSALLQGSEAISTSVEEMAEDVPHELVQPVNLELRQRGCSFQVRLSAAGSARPGCNPVAPETAQHQS